MKSKKSLADVLKPWRQLRKLPPLNRPGGCLNGTQASDEVQRVELGSMNHDSARISLRLLTALRLAQTKSKPEHKCTLDCAPKQ